MITGELRNKIDKVWETFWTGGISNPLTVIEQITYLLFIKRLDDLHTREELKANTLGKEIDNPVFNKKQAKLRWSRFKDLAPEEMYAVMSEQVFPFIKNLGTDKDSTFAKLMKDAAFMIPTPALLGRVVDMLDDITMDDRDTKGDLYEYLLSKIASAGQNGQFRTPRHIIGLMVALVQPGPDDVIYDPAAGTCGFLVGAAEYLRDKHPEIFKTAKLRKHFAGEMFHGNDFDMTMQRIGAMNMVLHGVDQPKLTGADALSELTAHETEVATVVLANPPFKGSLDESAVAKDLKSVVKTKKTELLFLALFLRLMKAGGRCACIVPDGVLFGSSKAHVQVRKTIIDEHRLQAIINMPSGVFKPYAGVSTAIMVFTKTGTGGTDKVWFYDMQADGFSLDDKRTPLAADKHETNNIPDIIKRWGKPKAEDKRARTDQSFFVPVQEIRDNKYDLSMNRYKEIVYEEVEYDPPEQILAEIKEMELEILEGIEDLQKMLAEGPATGADAANGGGAENVKSAKSKSKK